MSKPKNIVYAINGDELYSGKLIKHEQNGISAIQVNSKFTLFVDSKDVYTDSDEAWNVYSAMQADKEAMKNER